MNKCWIAFLVSGVVAAPVITAVAEDQSAAAIPRQAIEVVVTADNYERSAEEIASSVTVVSSDEIERKQQQNVLDLLRGVNSLDVVQNGGPGGNTSVFTRGANSEHTLVLIDGIEANNPILPGRAFNFSSLSTDNIERIEILRGPQSTLYGSDAMGGVINIITRKGEGSPSGFVSAEAGSYNSYAERTGLSGSEGMVSYSLGASRVDTHGISAADSRFGNKEHDGQDNTSISTRLGVEASENVGAQVVARYFSAKDELDNFGGAFGDDPNRVADDKEFFGRGEVNFKWLDGKLRQNVGYSYTDLKYEDNNDVDALNPVDMLRSKYSGRMQTVDLQNIADVNDSLRLVLGLATQVESGNSQYHSESAFGPYDDNFDNRSATTNSYYLQGELETFGRLYTTAGVRVDSHSKFGSEVTYRVGPALLFRETGTKIATTVGTAFKAPSLFQLYSSYGSQDLDSEKNLGVDVTVEQKLLDESLVAGVTFFHNKFDDLISFDPNTFQYSNIARASTQGLETWVRVNFCDVLTSQLGYTYTDTEDKKTGASLLRRPWNKVSADVTWAVSDDASLTASLLFTGRRFDNDYSTFPASRASLGSYALVNLSGSYNLTERVSLFARVENMFDREYEQVVGYGTPGAAVYGGFKLKL